MFMKKKNVILQFGEYVEGYDFPVLNEREIRAAAGILFLATFMSLMFIIFRNDFLPIKYVITFFLTDFLIRVFVNPRFSPTLVAGRLITGNQNPEYVGAIQKKFAWTIGVILSAVMFLFLVIVNSYSLVTGIGCLICLVFLFFESVFGICLGCKFYPLFFKSKVRYCPGEVCDPKKRQPVQKTSILQILVVLLFILYVFLVSVFFNKEFARKPFELFGTTSSWYLVIPGNECSMQNFSC